ncbi:hypothetical protein WN944_024577 [Citrus x changshan-huyou]|uniref:Uncharacterized protein n=1 Tax=Citrus x changshan-huyou TaxID=2935761 RepID=A0AAP0LUH6_9ROSI
MLARFARSEALSLGPNQKELISSFRYLKRIGMTLAREQSNVKLITSKCSKQSSSFIKGSASSDRTLPLHLSILSTCNFERLDINCFGILDILDVSSKFKYLRFTNAFISSGSPRREVRDRASFSDLEDYEVSETESKISDDAISEMERVSTAAMADLKA